jgi:SAM-dependent methyltransferase
MEELATDINILMRQGHVFIADVEQLCIELVEKHCKRLEHDTARQTSVLEIGCASGITSQQLAARLPATEVTAHEEYRAFAELAATRLRGTRVTLCTAPLATLTRSFDVMLSAGAHHHLPGEYLDEARRLLVDDGVFVLADEFCPEYCTAEERDHVRRAPLIYLANGYVLTSTAEVLAYGKDGTIPDRARQMEARRRRALWHWYRFVVDEAMRGDHIEVAIAELQSAHDDLVTGDAGEHKLAPCIVERQVALAGFQVARKHVLGPPDDHLLHSIIAYELTVPRR